MKPAADLGKEPHTREHTRFDGDIDLQVRKRQSMRLNLTHLSGVSNHERLVQQAFWELVLTSREEPDTLHLRTSCRNRCSRVHLTLQDAIGSCHEHRSDVVCVDAKCCHGGTPLK